jgi:hypothetical protein
MTHWRGFLNAIFGIWLISSPFTFGYKSEQLIHSDVICGVLVVIFGLLTIHFHRFAWGTALVGLWLQLAPLVFWAPEPASYLSDTFVGMLLLVFSIIIPDTPGTRESKGPEIPPGWSYNPSSYLQRIPVIGLNIICWLIARYMAAYQLGFIDHIWDPFFGQGTIDVLTSQVSKSFPIPDAGLGATAYLLEALFAFGSTRRWHMMPWFVMLFGVLAIPVSCVSIVLIILQPTVVGAWCGPCLTIACLMLLIIPLTADEICATLQFMKHSRIKGHSHWKTFWGGTPIAAGSRDPRTPPFNAPYRKLFAAMCWGVTIPWNLALSTAAGILAMTLGDFIPGALITVFSVIAWGEVTRGLRYAIIPLGIWLSFSNPLLGVAAIALSFRKGKIKEKYGSFKP